MNFISNTHFEKNKKKTQKIMLLSLPILLTPTSATLCITDEIFQNKISE